MLIHTRAIVINSLKYGEADLIVKCFTLQAGLQTYLLRGVLKSRKGKLKASLFQPLTQLEIVAGHKGKGTMEYLKEAKIYHSYRSLHTNVLKSSISMFISEMLRNTIKEEEQNENLYFYLEDALSWLDNHQSFSNFHLLFLLRYTRYLGFYPDVNAIDLQYFNLLEGIFQASVTNAYCAEGPGVEVLKSLLGTGFDEVQELKLNQSNRMHFLNLLLNYYQLHIEDFKKPKSLSVLHEIFR